MMSTNRKLTTICFAAALAFGLAACGGGGGSPPVTPPAPKDVSLADVTPGYNVPGAATHMIKAGASVDNGDVMFSCAADGDDCTVMVANDGSVKSTGGTVTAADSASYTQRRADQKAADDAKTVVRLHGVASEATADAKAASKAAEQAVKDADKYSGMLTVLSVEGDSSMATANAQKVLDARDDANQAVIDAEAAKTAAQNAKTEATALPDGTEGKTALVAALDAAIETAKDEIKAATEDRDDSGLKADVIMVIGTDTKKPKTAADKGREVADAISEAFTDETPRIPDLVSSGAPTTASATATKAVAMNNSQGMTWAEIVGAANIKMERIGLGNAALPVSSVAGMTASDVDSDLTATGGADNSNKYADAFSSGDSTYKGIPGSVYCLGKDCEVDSAGKLKGSWYFTPTSTTVPYVPHATTAGTYAAETLYVTYGHWLSLSGTDYSVNRYATLTGSSGTLDLAYPSQQDAKRTSDASYSGKAAGMSVLKTYDGKNKVTGVHSGSFTADVELTAKFGGSPTIEGEVLNFSGSAVDTDWRVTLKPAALSTTSQTDAAEGGGSAGTWSAQAYGEENKRPKGIFGGFNANFTNGNAAGAYATD